HPSRRPRPRWRHRRDRRLRPYAPPVAARRARFLRLGPVRHRRKGRDGDVLVRPAPHDARWPAHHRTCRAGRALPQYRPRHAWLDHGLRLGPRDRRSRLRQGARDRRPRPFHRPVPDMTATDPKRAGALLAIDLDAIVANYRALGARLSPARPAAVVKADAYGLGAGPVAEALARAGCTDFFVAHLD